MPSIPARQPDAPHSRALRALLGASLLLTSGFAAAAINCEERGVPDRPDPNGNIECRIDVEPSPDPEGGTASAVVDPIVLVRPFRAVNLDVCNGWSVGTSTPYRTVVFAELVFRQEGSTDVGVLVLSATSVRGDNTGTLGLNRVVFDWFYPRPAGWTYPPTSTTMLRSTPVGVAKTDLCLADDADPFSSYSLDIRVAGPTIKVYQGGVEQASASFPSRAPALPVQYRVNRHAFYVDVRLPDSIVRTNWRLISP